MGALQSVLVYLWKSEDNLKELSLSTVWDLGIKFRLPGLVGKCLYLLSYFTLSQNCSLNLLMLGFGLVSYLTIILV